MSKDRIVIPGIGKDAARVIIDELSALKDEIAALRRAAGRAGVIASDTAAKAGEFLNIEAPTVGLTVILPEATQALRNARVTMSFRNTNPVRIVAVQSTVNREAFVISASIGTFEAVCDGIDGWAVETGVTSSGLPTTATWADVLANGNTTGATNPTIDSGQKVVFAGTGASPSGGDIDAAGDLTLDSVGDMHLHAGGALHLGHTAITDLVHVEAAGEIDIGAGTNLALSAATTITEQAGTDWSAAAVAGSATINASTLIRLITGGVERLEIEPDGAWQVASDTGTAGAVLMSAGDSAPPTWHLPAVFLDTVTGSIGTYDLPSTFRSGDTLRLTITGNTTVVGFTIGGAVPAEGIEFNLCLSDQSGGSAPGWTLTIPDAGGGVAQFRTPGQVQGTVPGPSYVMQSEEEGIRCAFQQGAWRIIGGTAAQAITGAIEVSAGNGSTRTSIFATAASGAGLTGGGTAILAVGGSTSITVNANDIQRAALTGAITASANSNATAFGALAAKSVLANATNASAVPAALAGSAAFQHLRVNSANNALEWATLSGYASTSITYTSDTFQRAALTGEVTASANSNATTITRSTAFAWTGIHSFTVAAGSGNQFTVDVNGDISMTAAAIGMVSDSTILVDAVGDLTLASDGNVVVQGDALFVSTEGFIIVTGETGSTPSLTAGQGMFWALDPGANPTEPMFTADNNVDYPIFRGLASTASDVTSTSTTAATVEYTMAAGSNVAGTTYRLEAFVTYIKTAVNTTDPRFVIQIAGTNVAFIQIDQNANAGTFYFRVHGTFTVRTLGGAGVATYAVGLQVTGESDSTTQTLESIVNTPAAATLDTTASQTLGIGVALAASVASNSISINTATIERVYR